MREVSSEFPAGYLGSCLASSSIQQGKVSNIKSIPSRRRVSASPAHYKTAEDKIDLAQKVIGPEFSRG